MELRRLGKTDIMVSKICLGTMTFGEQNTETEAHEQLDYAIGEGINFIDTAEMYPVPPSKETQGLTEKYIGTWLAKRGKRNDLIIATKVTGPGNLKHISPHLGFSRGRILEAIDLSLKRLQTDYIDLYQLHWPERKTNFFGVRGYWKHDTRWEDNFYEAMETLDDLVQAGKIRCYGLSNETPWGLHRNLTISEQQNLLRPVSVQNPYSLLNRNYEVGLSEMSMREKVGLLAYSPMAMGFLSGKYHKKEDAPRDRLNQFPQYKRYRSENCYQATLRYLKLAEEHQVSLAQMSLAFVTQMPFVTSNIIGATTMQQLKENIASKDVTLSKEIIKAINTIHEEIPNPAT